MWQKDTVVDHRSTMMNTANNNKVMRTDRVLTTYKKAYQSSNKIPLYVHGPNGILLKYDPITKEETCISSDLPISPKRPWLD